MSNQTHAVDPSFLIIFFQSPLCPSHAIPSGMFEFVRLSFSAGSTTTESRVIAANAQGEWNQDTHACLVVATFLSLICQPFCVCIGSGDNEHSIPDCRCASSYSSLPIGCSICHALCRLELWRDVGLDFWRSVFHTVYSILVSSNFTAYQKLSRFAAEPDCHLQVGC